MAIEAPRTTPPPASLSPSPGQKPRLSPARNAINAFVARRELPWDLSMAALALTYILAGFFEDHPYGVLTLKNLIPVEIGITAIFLAEFSARYYAAASRGAYLRRHWIDLLALLPAIRYLRLLRLGRIIYLLQAARFLRLGVFARFLVQSDRVGNQVRWIAERNGVHVVLLVALGFVMIGGSLVWELEHATNQSLASFGDAIWWAFATMTTVGYGQGPMTLPGRVLGGVIMVIGIGCFGLITATVTAYFIEHSRGHQVSPNELMAVLEDIRQRLSRLEQEETHGTATLASQPAVSIGTNGQRRGDDSLRRPETDRTPG
jgi:voltage-gated potassium channel